MDERRFGFIGTGHMGGALARAVAGAIDGERILLSNRTVCRAELLAEELGAVCVSVPECAEKSYYIFLGVKPQMLPELAEQLVPILRARKDRFVLVSMAAGVPVERLHRLFNADWPVVRLNPNTPVAIGRGMGVWCSDGVSEAEEDELFDALTPGGVWDRVPEKLMDVAGTLGGCTPAFTYMFIEALADGAVRCGLPRQKALLYAAGAVEGAAALLRESGEHPGALKDAVCSPKGSTIVGVNVLEEHAFRAAAMDAICASVERTEKMGR